MKRSLLSLALVAASVFAVQAQVYTVGYFATTNGASASWTGVTNGIAANTTQTINSPATITRWPGLCLTVGFNQSGAGTGNTTFTFAKSADGVNWETSPFLAIALAGNGTTAVNYVTNFSEGSLPGYIRLVSIANTNASLYLTNVIAQYAKIPRR